VATSSGPKPANFTQCTLKDGAPTGSEYGSKPTAPQPSKLPLPAGKQTDKNYPQESIA
jgi:hypothetical protein